MNKSQLIEKIAEKTDLSKSAAGRVLEAFTDSISESLVEGEAVQILGFGSFEVRSRAARVGRNPKTGAEIQIEASKTAGFKAGKALKDALK